MLLIPGGIATFIGLHLYLVTKLGISEPPWAKRRMRIDRDEEDARRAAVRERIIPGRTAVPSSMPVQVEASAAGSGE